MCHLTINWLIPFSLYSLHGYFFMLWLLSGEFYPFMPNGISYCCQLDQSISVLRVVLYFSFLFKF